MQRVLAYVREYLAGDACGGLAAMLVALPSAVAFGVTIFSPLGGTLAAKGAMAGILGATALGLCAPLFSSSARLITSPCAPAAAMLSALMIEFVRQGVSAESALLQLLLIGLLAGGFQIILGLARIGRLIKFIPYPVVSGYMSGVGLIIITSQIPKLLGAPPGTGLVSAVSGPSVWAWQGIVVGGVVIIVMMSAPHIIRAVPATILALIAGVGTYLGLGVLDPVLMQTEHNALLVGALGSDGSLADLFQQNWRALSGFGSVDALGIVVPALTLAALLSIDTLKTCVVLDVMTCGDHNPNRELIGQGFGNMASAFLGGIPGSGTMGASLVNLSSGGRSRASGVLEGLFCFAALLVLSPLIAWVPVAALAGILIVIGFKMIDLHSLTFFYSRSTRLDFFVITAVIVVALFGNLIAASGVGVALSILLFIREQTRSTVVHSRIEGDLIFSKRQHDPVTIERLAGEEGDTVVFELQGSLFFGTADQLHAALEPETGTRKFVILSMRRVQSLDLTATHVLEQIKDRLEGHNAYLVFCDIPKGLPSGLKMKRFLKETGVVRPTNKAFAFRQLEEALEWVENQKLGGVGFEGSGNVVYDLSSMPIFAGQDEETMSALQGSVTVRLVHADKKIFRVGDGADELFLIRQGSVKINVPIHKKEHYHLATCGPGEFVGGSAFLSASMHTTDAVALSDVEVYVLPRERFLSLSQAHPDLVLKIVEHIAHSLSTRLHAAVTEIQTLRG